MEWGLRGRKEMVILTESGSGSGSDSFVGLRKKKRMEGERKIGRLRLGRGSCWRGIRKIRATLFCPLRATPFCSMRAM